MSLKTKNYKTILYIFLIILLQFLIKFSTAQAYTENYTVKDVEIIQPYDLDFNKLKIYDMAFTKAFDHLISKITTSDNEIDTGLEKYGTSFFRTLQSSFMPVNIPNMSGDYIIDVGDAFCKERFI